MMSFIHHLKKSFDLHWSLLNLCKCVYHLINLTIFSFSDVLYIYQER